VGRTSEEVASQGQDKEEVGGTREEVVVEGDGETREEVTVHDKVLQLMLDNAHPLVVILLKTQGTRGRGREEGVEREKEEKKEEGGEGKDLEEIVGKLSALNLQEEGGSKDQNKGTEGGPKGIPAEGPEGAPEGVFEGRREGSPEGGGERVPEGDAEPSFRLSSILQEVESRNQNPLPEGGSGPGRTNLLFPHSPLIAAFVTFCRILNKNVRPVEDDQVFWKKRMLVVSPHHVQRLEIREKLMGTEYFLFPFHSFPPFSLRLPPHSSFHLP
jgi:hypothetical protein